ncbi:BTAD domain-containing putative transcriptional regulator [Nocardia tengchongensis]|uniref:AfsR/SARP family transcriptional regulator n=1 Tax=Nocardia tengchongensis TaxID=2055889 RepID=UPI0036BF803A
MRIAILGPLEVSADDRPIPVSGTRLRGLLIRLALDPGRTVSVGTLITDLWPEAPPKRPEHALHELVSRLRRTLPPEAPIRSGAGGYLLDIAGLSVDIHRFERLVRGGSVSARRGDRTRAVHQLREALALWRGPALSDIATLPFAAATATRLDELRAIATESALAIELPARAGDPLLITELEALLAAHPLRERPRLLHIQALHDAARTAEALTAYDRYRILLATELGIDPGPELAALHLKLLRSEAPGGQAGDSPDSAVAHRDPRIISAMGASSAARLRVPLTRFIGRELELSEVGRLVGSERLVTLVGPGGAGKTRLAVAVANEVGGRFAGGVGMAELAAVTDSSDLPQAVAAALGVASSRTVEHSAGDPMGLLAEALPTAPTLLVLDNCEHLIDGVARFAEDLLGRVPELRVLATSRQSLGVAGETLWETAPLAVPPANSADVDDYPSVRLFLDRAAAVRPELAHTEADLETVAEICRRLDGLPLALELAAAKLRVMPLSVLHSRLDDRFTVLSGGNRTALPRHRTLRAVLDWDWELLDAVQRTDLARLSVFPAPFTPPAAEGIGVGSAELEALLDKSLLQLVDVTYPDSNVAAPQPRYRMLESVRTYGLEHLTARGELYSTKAAHLAYYASLAESAHPHLRGRDQLPWLELLDADRDHLIAALRFAHESDDTATGARLGSALGMYWALHANHHDAVRLLRPILEQSPAHPHPPLAAAFALHSMLAAQASELAAATDHIRRWTGIDHRDPSDGSAELAWALVELATGRVDAGLAVVEPWLSHPDAWTQGMFWLVRSFLHANESGLARLDADLRMAAACFEAAGERWGHSTALTYLAFTSAALSDFGGAEEAMASALAAARELGRPVGLRVWLVMVRLHCGEVESARADLIALAGESLSAGDTVMTRLLAADIARFDGDLPESACCLRLAENDLERAVGEDRSHRAMFGLRMSLLRAAEGRITAAATHCADAWANAVAIRDLPMAAEVSVGVARTCLAAGASEAAAEALGAGHALRGAADANHPDIVALRRELDATLGAEQAATAYERGRALRREEAVATIEACLRTATKLAAGSRSM